MNIDNNLRHLLENETKIHLAEIRFLYQKLDRQLGLNGARVPITFGFDTDRLGAYTPGFGQDEEEFHFSLLFIGYCVTKPLSRMTGWIYISTNMPTICNIIWIYRTNTTGSPASTEVRGNTAAHLSEQLPLLTTKPVKDLLSTIMIRFSKRKLLTRVFLSATHIHVSRNTAKRKTVL